MSLMENDNDKVVKTENMGEAGANHQKSHGFSSQSPGTWNQDSVISSAEKGSKANVPPKQNATERKAA